MRSRLRVAVFEDDPLFQRLIGEAIHDVERGLRVFDPRVIVEPVLTPHGDVLLTESGGPPLRITSPRATQELLACAAVVVDLKMPAYYSLRDRSAEIFSGKLVIDWVTKHSEVAPRVLINSAYAKTVLDHRIDKRWHAQLADSINHLLDRGAILFDKITGTDGEAMKQFRCKLFSTLDLYRREYQADAELRTSLFQIGWEQRKGRSKPVLIWGESGTGKEEAAHHIHALGHFALGQSSTEVVRNEPAQDMQSINCAGLSDELAESALFGHVKGAFTGAQTESHGVILSTLGGDKTHFSEEQININAPFATVFLDEVGLLSLIVQGKLLRFLADGVVRKLGDTRTFRLIDTFGRLHVRIIAATNSREVARLLGLEEARQNAGGVGVDFREDLFYRLNRWSLLTSRLHPDEVATVHGAEGPLTVKARRSDSDYADVTFDQDALQDLRSRAGSFKGHRREALFVLERCLAFGVGRMESRALRSIVLGKNEISAALGPQEVTVEKVNSADPLEKRLKDLNLTCSIEESGAVAVRTAKKDTIDRLTAFLATAKDPSRYGIDQSCPCDSFNRKVRVNEDHRIQVSFKSKAATALRMRCANQAWHAVSAEDGLVGPDLQTSQGTFSETGASIWLDALWNEARIRYRPTPSGEDQ